MKKMTPLLVLLLSFSAGAQVNYDLNDPRQAERDARDNAYYNGGYNQTDNGYIVPGHRPGGPGRPGQQPGRPQPPRPPQPGRPQPPPQYGYDYGPNRTARWADMGQTRLPKIVTQDVVIDVRGQFVNEILLRAIDNDVQIQSAVAYLSNGQAIDLQYVRGNLGEGRELRTSLDYRYSVRVDRIVIHAGSPNLIGSRASLSTILGLAY